MPTENGCPNYPCRESAGGSCPTLTSVSPPSILAGPAPPQPQAITLNGTNLDGTYGVTAMQGVLPLPISPSGPTTPTSAPFEVDTGAAVPGVPITITVNPAPPDPACPPTSADVATTGS